MQENEGIPSDVVIDRVDSVATVTLNRPERLNALDDSLRQGLARSFDQLGRNPDVRVIVLTGVGKAFCSGADLKSTAANPDTGPRRTARTLLHDFQPLIECITRIDKPVIAAVNGAAAGFGMSLVLACDVVVMVETAYLLSPFTGLGLIPDGGAAWFLARRIGYVRAFEMLANGQRVGAARCFELGLVNRVVSTEGFRETTNKMALDLAARAPLALALTKRIARLSMTSSLSDSLTMEAELQTYCASTDDVREAVAAFAEKRPPSFSGR